MATPRTIDTYGGVFTDASPVEDPTTTQSAAQYTRHSEDTAQMTRTSLKAWVKFKTSAAAAPVTITPDAGYSHMGVDGAALPVVTKTATGEYRVTYTTPFTDGLGESEAISFNVSHGHVSSAATFGLVQTTESAAVVFVYVATTGAVASDLGGAIDIEVFAY